MTGSDPQAEHSPVKDHHVALRGRHHGQILILYTVMLTTLLGFAALGVDVAYLFANKRAMQGAADLAALAGAMDLPAATTAKASAQQYATSNGYENGVNTVTVVPVTPYKGSPGKIEVTITQAMPTFFANIFGISTVDISARAVAQGLKMGPGILALDTDCSDGVAALDWSGSDATIEGTVHSNGGFKISGSDNAVEGPTTYGCEYGGDINSGSNNTFGSGPSIGSYEPDPLGFTAADFESQCTETSTGDMDVLAFAVGGVILDGVYCAYGTVKLSQSALTGNMTFVGLGPNGKVHVSGSDLTLTPRATVPPQAMGVLFYAESAADDAIKLSGSGNTWNGIIYAPNGTTDISGSADMSSGGMIVSHRVKFSGSSWHINAGEDVEIRRDWWSKRAQRHDRHGTTHFGGTARAISRLAR